MIKRLKKENKNLMREVKKLVKRKLVSESEEDDSDTTESSMDDRSPKRKRETEMRVRTQKLRMTMTRLCWLSQPVLVKVQPTTSAMS